MPNTVAQHAVATFTSPVNGTTPIDANTVRGNDNTTRTSYNNHDADPGIHLQSSTLASRPVAGTAGRKWITADTGSYRVWYDDGTTWQEVTYLSGGGGTISGNLLITGTLGVTGLITATGGVSGNVTGNLTGNASTATALATARNINGVSFNGTADITVTAAAGTLSGSTLASGVTASSLTSVGTLTSLNVAGATTLTTAGSQFSLVGSTRTGGFRVTGSLLEFRDVTGGTNIATLDLASGQLSALYAMSVAGNLAVDTNTLFVDAVNNAVGIQTATPAYPLQVRRSGGAGSLGISIDNAVSARTVQYFAIGDSTADTTAHAWYTRAGTATDVLRLALDYPGNLGLGVTPSAWGIGKAIEVGATGNAIWGVQAADMRLLVNAYYDGTNYRYNHTATAGRYDCGAIHSWFTAPSGTAGNAISFTERARVDGTTTAGQTALLLWDVDNGTLERVTVGASDSGGTGFKVLRIPN